MVPHMNPEQDTRGLAAAEIRAAVARKGIPYGELSEKTGIERTVLSRKMRGSTPFGIEEVISIAQVIGEPPMALVNAAAYSAISSQNGAAA